MNNIRRKIIRKVSPSPNYSLPKFSLIISAAHWFILVSCLFLLYEILLAGMFGAL